MKKIINAAGSIKFAGSVLFCIILLSLLGSFVPQGNEVNLMRRLDETFGTNAHYVYDVLKFTGFTDIYSSRVFIVLLFLFAVSLTICTWRLIPFMISGYKNINPDSINEETPLQITEGEFLKRLLYNGWKLEEQPSGIFKVSRHAFGRSGVIVLHVGIIVVLLGALAGYTFGYKAFMNILEGDSDNVAVLPDGKLVPLGFDVRCDNFSVTYYPDSARAKAYESTLTITENGVPVKMENVDVNRPLRHKGITFYQTSFGVYPNKDVKAILSITTNGTESTIVKKFGEPFKISGNLIGKITDFAPTLTADEDGRIFSSSDEMRNPAVLLEVYDIDEPFLRAWVLKNNPDSGDFTKEGFKVVFSDMFGLEYTGLSVKKDPGTAVLYAGFALICLGLFLIYLLNYTAIFFKFGFANGISVITYTVKQQRRHPIVTPADSFFKLTK